MTAVNLRDDLRAMLFFCPAKGAVVLFNGEPSFSPQRELGMRCGRREECAERGEYRCFLTAQAAPPLRNPNDGAVLGPAVGLWTRPPTPSRFAPLQRAPRLCDPRFVRWAQAATA